MRFQERSVLNPLTFRISSASLNTTGTHLQETNAILGLRSLDLEMRSYVQQELEPTIGKQTPLVGGSTVAVLVV
jgi:hypothetical protein